MEITVGELMSLNRAINELSNIKLDTVLAYKIARLLKKVAEEVSIVEENRIKLIMPFIEKDENGKPIIDGETYSTIKGKELELNQELNKFFSTKIKIDLPTLNLEELEKIEITPIQMTALMPIIEE